MDANKMASKLRILRREQGETQAETAEAVGITAAAYGMYETGERIPRDPIKEKLAEHFKKSIEFIFFDKSNH